jgi:hypothetical protein
MEESMEKGRVEKAGEFATGARALRYACNSWQRLLCKDFR